MCVWTDTNLATILGSRFQFSGYLPNDIANAAPMTDAVRREAGAAWVLEADGISCEAMREMHT